MGNKDNLPAILPGINPEGGLEIFNDDEINNPLGEYVYGAESIFERLNITTATQLMQTILLVHSFNDRMAVSYLLAEGMKRGILHKQDLMTLYLSQSERSRVYSPIITLEEMWQIPFRAFPRNHGDKSPIAAAFSKEEIIGLAERVKEISGSDIYMFFQQWFYRAKEFPFSKEFVLRYYKNTERRRIEGKLESLIAIAASCICPEEVTLEDVKQKMIWLAESDPESHGIYRYLGLLFWIAGEDKKKRKWVIQAYVELVITMVHRSARYFPGPSFAVEMFIEEPGIAREEKVEGLKAINKALQEKANYFLEITGTIGKELEKIEHPQPDLFE